MLFSDAIERFRRFLTDQGHGGPLVWITPSDLMWSGSALLIRPRVEAADESERIFNKAAERGYGVSLEAVARLDHSLCCFVFAPETPEEAASDFVAPPVTMKVRQDLRAAEHPSSLRWWLARKMASERTHTRTRQLFGHDLGHRERLTTG
jgi:hypothetical protein